MTSTNRFNNKNFDYYVVYVTCFATAY